jgi:hypothetical protein
MEPRKEGSERDVSGNGLRSHQVDHNDSSYGGGEADVGYALSAWFTGIKDPCSIEIHTVLGYIGRFFRDGRLRTAK